MLRIVDYDDSNNYRTLRHSDDVFHKALKAVLNGEKRFHVVGAEEKYDLIYEDNNDFFFSGNDLSKKNIMAGETMQPPYYFYDENDDTKFYFRLIERFDNIVFETANEYTIVLAKVLLRLTDKEIYFIDKRAGWFIGPNDKLHLGSDSRQGSDPNKKEARIVESKRPMYFFENPVYFNSTFLFHEIFLMQWISGDVPLKDIKYVEFCVKKTEGIGALLQFCVKCKNFFEEFGIKSVFKLGSSRYNDELLKKYFRIETTPDDSDESNTIYLVNYMAVVRSSDFLLSQAKISLDMLNPDFIKEMDEYCEAILGNKRMLGVLFRGTDYKIMMGSIKNHPMAPVSVETMIPVIQEWIDKYRYDGIFVATEDGAALKYIREAFPNKVFAVAQERHTMEEFKPGSTISELEKDTYNENEYEDKVTDTTINYFYALYILSKCEGFLASCQCSGVPMVRAFNDGKFECDDVVREMVIKGQVEEVNPTQ